MNYFGDIVFGRYGLGAGFDDTVFGRITQGFHLVAFADFNDAVLNLAMQSFHLVAVDDFDIYSSIILTTHSFQLTSLTIRGGN